VACYPYVHLAEGIPPALILNAILYPPDWAESTKQYKANAFLDARQPVSMDVQEIF
jgi:hypothetical protein